MVAAEVQLHGWNPRALKEDSEPWDKLKILGRYPDLLLLYGRFIQRAHILLNPIDSRSPSLTDELSNLFCYKVGDKVPLYFLALDRAREIEHVAQVGYYQVGKNYRFSDTNCILAREKGPQLRLRFDHQRLSGVNVREAKSDPIAIPGLYTGILETP